jgi:hypothetical protein
MEKVSSTFATCMYDTLHIRMTVNSFHAYSTPSRVVNCKACLQHTHDINRGQSSQVKRERQGGLLGGTAIMPVCHFCSTCIDNLVKSCKEI